MYSGFLYQILILILVNRHFVIRTGGCGAMYGNICYTYHPVSATWQQASDACVALGAQLADVEDARENEIIFSIITANTWIDGKTANSPREVIWQTSEITSVIDYFADGEPNNAIGYSIQMYSGNGRWDDTPEHYERHYMCEHRDVLSVYDLFEDQWCDCCENYGELQSTDPYTCSRHCSLKPGCIGFVIDGTVCRIKSVCIRSHGQGHQLYLKKTIDHASLGLSVSLGSKFNGSIISISGAHTTPIDCLQLCEATEGCNVFAFSNELNQCGVGIGREESVIANSDFDSYYRAPMDSSALFNVHTGMRLNNCVLVQITVAIRLRCLHECISRPSCLSVNVRASDAGRGFECQLNYGVRSSQDCTFVADEHVWLYEFSP